MSSVVLPQPFEQSSQGRGLCSADPLMRLGVRAVSRNLPPRRRHVGSGPPERGLARTCCPHTPDPAGQFDIPVTTGRRAVPSTPTDNSYAFLAGADVQEPWRDHLGTDNACGSKGEIVDAKRLQRRLPGEAHRPIGHVASSQFAAKGPRRNEMPTQRDVQVCPSCINRVRHNIRSCRYKERPAPSGNYWPVVLVLRPRSAANPGRQQLEPLPPTTSPVKYRV